MRFIWAWTGTVLFVLAGTAKGEPAAKPVEKPAHTVRKSLKEQPRFGRSA